MPCSHCHKGYWVPSNPKAEYNSWFTCSHCGTRRHIERNVTVE
nr:MAG TPA: zinc-ribbon domain protein [Caudoviricetes sp.]